MAKETEKQHAVESSNLKSVGFYNSSNSHPFIRIEFQRGASYDYWPVTEKEFQSAFVPGVKISEWFNTFKTGKHFKKVE